MVWDRNICLLLPDSPSRTGWEDDDATPLRRSAWDLPTPADSGRDRRDGSVRSDRSVRSERSDLSHRGHDRTHNRYGFNQTAQNGDSKHTLNILNIQTESQFLEK